MTKRSRVRISQSLIYLIKIKHKIILVYTSFKLKRFLLEVVCLALILYCENVI